MTNTTTITYLFPHHPHPTFLSFIIQKNNKIFPSHYQTKPSSLTPPECFFFSSPARIKSTHLVGHSRTHTPPNFSRKSYKVGMLQTQSHYHNQSPPPFFYIHFHHHHTPTPPPPNLLDAAAACCFRVPPPQHRDTHTTHHLSFQLLFIIPLFWRNNNTHTHKRKVRILFMNKCFFFSHTIQNNTQTHTHTPRVTNTHTHTHRPPARCCCCL